MDKFNKFYDGIFCASPRKFGSLSEMMIESLYKLYSSKESNYDRLDKNRNRIEIKFSRCSCSHKKSNNIIEEIINENNQKYLSSNSDKEYWCNIQQVKPNEFDYLYYGIFFTDKIMIFKTKSENIKKIPAYSNKQHRGNIGEGQFALNQKTINWHIENNFEQELSYNQLYDVLNQWISK